jgi:ribonucleoside-diphosphate reductase alpha chain
VDINKFGVQPRWMKSQSASADIEVNREVAATEMPATAVTSACSLDDDCEACQ